MQTECLFEGGMNDGKTILIDDDLDEISQDYERIGEEPEGFKNKDLVYEDDASKIIVHLYTRVSPSKFVFVEQTLFAKVVQKNILRGRK